jgi:hypothetical protein
MKDEIHHNAQESLTIKGETVKSISEKKIADFFHAYKIKYDYERSIRINNQRLIPDFYLREFGVFVEFWGLKDFKKYKNRMKKKKRLYRKYNLKLVSLYPEDLKNLDSVFFSRLKSLIKR